MKKAIIKTSEEIITEIDEKLRETQRREDVKKMRERAERGRK